MFCGFLAACFSSLLTEVIFSELKLEGSSSCDVQSGWYILWLKLHACHCVCGLIEDEWSGVDLGVVLGLTGRLPGLRGCKPL